jgi:hypothetical protein
MIINNFKEQFMNSLKNMCDKSIFDNKTLGIIIRSMHLNAPINMLIVASFAPKLLVIFNTIVLSISATLFVLFNGCFLSKIEYYLCKDSFTIVDPFLIAMDFDVNNINRNIITYYGLTFYVYIYLSILYFRFIHKK